jgi:hypothetical protein
MAVQAMALVLNANKSIVGLVTPRNHRSRYEINRGREEKQPAEESAESSIYGQRFIFTPRTRAHV